MPEARAVLVKNLYFFLLLQINALFPQSMREPVFVNLFTMPAAQVLVNVEIRLSDYVAKREDITVVRSGFHFVLFLSSAFPVLCFLCLFVAYACLKSMWPCGSSKCPPSYIFLPWRKVFCTTPLSTSPAYGVILWR